MNDEARLLFGMWEVVGDFIPVGDRVEAASGLIRVLIEQGGNDIDLLHDAEGECPHLDRALAAVADEMDEEEDDMVEDLDEY